MLTRDAILSCNDLETVEVQVPEWGGSVLARGLTAHEKGQFEQAMITVSGSTVNLELDSSRANLVYFGCVDENGMRLFRREDLPRLNQKSAVAMDRVADAVRKLSGFSEEDMKQITENFTNAPKVDSPIG
jgi:hypothetical protein